MSALAKVGAAAARLATAVSGRAAMVAARVPVGVVLLGVSAVSVLLGLWQKYPCDHGQSPPDYGWSHACYTDVLPLFGGRGFGEGKLPYLQSPIEYPVLIGLYMGAIGLPIHWLATRGLLDGPASALGFHHVDQGIVFFWATAFVNGLLVLATTWMLYQLRRDRPWDVLLWAVAPSMIFAFTVNWDMLAVAPTVAALLAWKRGRPVWAGVWLGLGTAAKLFPVLLLFPLVLLCLRRRTPAARTAAVRVVIASACAWLAVNVPFAIASTSNWFESYRFSRDRWIDWGTLYFLGDHLSSAIGMHDLIWPAMNQVHALNRTSLVIFVIACALLALLVLTAPEPPRVTAVAFLAVAAFLLTNKVWSQQFVLWLIPLVVLARPRATAFFGWQALEVAYLFAFLRSVLGGRDDYALVQTALGRYVGLVVLVVLVVGEALWPARDVLRGPDLADPDAGPLAVPPPRTASEDGDEDTPEEPVELRPDGSAPEVVPLDAEVLQQATQQG